MTQAILLSGGMDSVALTYWLKPQYAFTIDYGQLPAEAEFRASQQICLQLGIQHYSITANCHSLGSGDLAGVPAEKCAPAPEWWPYRNQLLITLAAMRAISLGVEELIFGTVKSDGFHQDGQPEFFERMNALLAAQEGRLKVTTPAIGMTTVQLVQKSAIPRSLLSWAHSCHKSNLACGYCRGCNKHREVTQGLGYDPY